MQQEKIISTLGILGLTEKEAAVYAALLTFKQAGALRIAERAGIKRPTAYLVLKTLEIKGLARSTRFRGVRDWRALPIGNLRRYVYDQKKAADKVLPDLEARYKKREVKNRLRFYRGLQSLKTILEKTIREQAPLTIFGSAEFFQEFLGDYWDFFLKRARQQGLKTVVKKYDGNASLLLWSDKVIFVEMNEDPQLLGWKNGALHDWYKKLCENFSATSA